MPDMRKKRTQRFIYDNFYRLLTKNLFSNITVKQIVDTAMIHRNTFYHHFTDKYDLMKHFCWDYLFLNLKNFSLDEFKTNPFYMLSLLYNDDYHDMLYNQQYDKEFNELCAPEFAKFIIKRSHKESMIWIYGRIVSVLIWNQYHHNYYNIIDDSDKLDKIFQTKRFPNIDEYLNILNKNDHSTIER